MAGLTSKLDRSVLIEERLKGARLSVYFRWVFILVISLTLSTQLIYGYRAESLHSISLAVVYLVSNILLWVAVRKKFDPVYLGYLSAILDTSIIGYHLYTMTLAFDQTAVTAAATMFLFPIVFLLYTFRLDRKLLIFLITIALIAFNMVYYLHYFGDADFYESYLSLSPLSHLFKSIYILFIGVLCLYFQYSMFLFLMKQIKEAREKAELHTEVLMQEERNQHSQQLIEQEKRLNKNLEETIQQRTRELTEANTKVISLQKENLQTQFEVLKQQVNPHFLFNSLNVLTSLIKVDPDLAESFTERLAKVYRYVLENKDKDLIELQTELDFLKAYIFLIDIRFKDKVFVTIQLEESRMNEKVVPLAIQLLIENAIKHNAFSKKTPLNITIEMDNNNYLRVINNLQNRETRLDSTGVGLENIRKRYELLSDRKPYFKMESEHFVAGIPML